MAPRAHLNDLLKTGVITSAVSTVAILIASKRQTGSLAAGLNATSHILWGDRAARRDRFDFSHTVLGGLLNAGAMFAWSAVQEFAFPRPRSPVGAALVGAAVSGLAYLTDYYVVPKRLTPGFEMRLSPGAILGIYSALALALAAGTLVASERAEEPPSELPSDGVRPFVSALD